MNSRRAVQITIFIVVIIILVGCGQQVAAPEVIPSGVAPTGTATLAPPTSTSTPTQMPTPTYTPIYTPTPTYTPTQTPTPTSTSTPTPTATPTYTPTPSPTPTPTCELECSGSWLGLNPSLEVGITCEAGKATQTTSTWQTIEDGKGWVTNFEGSRTYEDTGHEYKMAGSFYVVLTAEGNRKVVYHVKVTGGAFGETPQVCESD